MTALRVLHVDDEPDIREVVELSLGFDPDVVTRGCGTGLEALSVAADWRPDIILLDVMMPEMDGPTTLARLRENSKTAEIPVVFMTARAQTRELETFRSLGAAGVLPKPFDPMTLAASVRSYVPPPEDALVKLRNVFLKRIEDDGSILDGFLSAFKDGTASHGSPATLDGIRRIAHGLAGTGGIYGFSEISKVAGALEDEVILEINGFGSPETIAGALHNLLTSIKIHISKNYQAKT
jgi:CheY-like chemotaxis protein